LAVENGSKTVKFAIFERYSGADARLFVTEYLASATEYLASATEYLVSATNNLASAPEYLVSGINNLVSATEYLGCGGNNLEYLLENLVEEADNLDCGRRHLACGADTVNADMPPHKNFPAVEPSPAMFREAKYQHDKFQKLHLRWRNLCKNCRVADGVLGAMPDKSSSSSCSSSSSKFEDEDEDVVVSTQDSAAMEMATVANKMRDRPVFQFKRRQEK